jgi:hypothetical protein
MESVDLGRLARRVTIVPAKGTDVAPIVVYERKRKKRKGTAMFRRLEKLLRSSMRAQRAFADEYLRLHDESNVKKRDGWMKDGMYNQARAGRKAMKVLRKSVF